MSERNLNEMVGSRLAVAAACRAVLSEEVRSPQEENVRRRSRKIIQWPEKKIPVLLASPDREDHLVLPELLGQREWQWSRSRNRRQAEKRLQRGRIRVVLCERDLPDGSWRDLLETCQSLEKPPSLIVCSRFANEQLWSRVLNLGGYDVLIKPFDREEVLRVVNAAWRAWRRVFAEPAGGRPTPRVPTSGAEAF